jgi:hypothetical protein
MNDANRNIPSTLADYPNEVIRLACDRCDRKGQYRRSTLITLFGATASLNDVLNELARCQRAREASEPCGACFSDLK